MSSWLSKDDDEIGNLNFTLCYAEADEEWIRHSHPFNLPHLSVALLGMKICHLDIDEATQIPILLSPVPPYVTLLRPPDGLEYLIQLCMRCLRGTKVFIELSINRLIRPNAFTEIHVCLNNLWADFLIALQTQSKVDWIRLKLFAFIVLNAVAKWKFFDMNPPNQLKKP